MKIFFKVNKRKRVRGRHRKKRRDWFHHIQEFIWPSIGGRAFLRFMEIKLKRARGTAHGIALGFAMGAFASFTPFMGFHSLIAVALSVPFGGSAIMAILGTIVGNPWTFPAIWLASYNLGNFLLGRHASAPEFLVTFDINEIWADFAFYADNFIWPMTVGGVPMGALAATLIYIVLYNNLNRYRKSRQKFLRDRRSKLYAVKETASAVKEKASALKDKIAEKVTKD